MEKIDMNEKIHIISGKPYPNEHAARIKSPAQYDDFARQNDKFGEGIHAIFGIKDNKSELQAIRFDKNKFTVAEAKAWLKDHDITYISFEPAQGEESINMPEKNSRTKIGNKIFEISDFKASKDNNGNIVIEGYANTKNQADRYGDIPTVLTQMRGYVYELKNFKKNPIMMLQHGHSVAEVAGSFSEDLGGYVKEDEKGLKVRGIFSNSSHPDVAHARTLVQEGHLKAFSIGGRWAFEDQSNPNHLTYADIYEISLVPIPADPDALSKELDKLKSLQNELKNGNTSEEIKSEFLELSKKYSVIIDLPSQKSPQLEKQEDISSKVDTIVRVLLK